MAIEEKEKSTQNVRENEHGIMISITAFSI